MERPFIQEYDGLLGADFFSDTSAIKYQPDFESLDGNVILSGYFQNEQYFKKDVESTRMNFNFKEPLSGKNWELTDKLICTDSIALHVRRRDFLSDQNTVSDFKTCSKEYYQAAIEYMMGKVLNPQFYVFSDDMEWVKNNISFRCNRVVYVDWNRGSENYRDMQLLSLCTHNIIANSSFSWWAAWLNANSSKIVIAPQEWFLCEEPNTLLSQFYPCGWIKL